MNADTAERLLGTALSALSEVNGWQPTLDALPVPVYVTDREGNVTYWNRACVEFAGRQPELGQDKWCVTWKIYTTYGEYLPHAECPMAEAIRKGREVRGKVAIALRPDGSRRAFRPYPTPLFGEDGAVTGAVNMLIDVTAEQVPALTAQAARCRRLSLATHDQRAADMLRSMALGYAETSEALRGEMAGAD